MIHTNHDNNLIQTSGKHPAKKSVHGETHGNEPASVKNGSDTLVRQPRNGAILPETPKRLQPDEITRELKTKVVGSSVITYEQTTSTMDIAKRIARTGFKNGTVIFAEEQTQGKGRSGHSWFCPRYKGLLFTLLLRHTIPQDHLCLFVGTMAVSITETIRETLHLPAEIKWPNDILIGRKKVGGVLVEWERGRKNQSVFLVGIGLNVNSSEEELPKQTRLPATSLSLESHSFIDRISLAKALLHDIDRWFSILKDEHFGYITEQWKNLCITVGETLTMKDGGAEYTGKVIDISNNGGLMLRLDNGR
ncbi:MAG: biotin-(acetyl-CoA-carboxylase) ligase [Candidatus Brocadia fulgida]|uniref:Biotin-(Acetyl-CoA-carboxylase) ligase n=1 Tax=Candidatus Brocadia fulgida TaxID=380242 RepID=A0A0M2V382_9BACT|nr:MAG: biotin-(acetyl-CoA-carboxylase) ligase [Candidatus Brocadia fulgida]